MSDYSAFMNAVSNFQGSNNAPSPSAQAKPSSATGSSALTSLTKAAQTAANRASTASTNPLQPITVPKPIVPTTPQTNNVVGLAGTPGETFGRFMNNDTQLADYRQQYQDASNKVAELEKELRTFERQYSRAAERGNRTDAMKQEYIDRRQALEDAKTALEAAEKQYKDNGGTDPNFFTKVWDDIKAGGKGIASATDAALGNLYTLESKYNVGGGRNDRTGASWYNQEAEQQRQQEISDRQREAGQQLIGRANQISESAAQDAAEANMGAGAVGRFANTVVQQAVPLAADIVANAIVPGSGMAAMAVRAYGGGVQEALNDGATDEEAALYGLASAGVETLTEKIGGIAPGYGKGLVDGVTDKLLDKAKSETGRKVVQLAMAALEEGGEEALSTLLNPVIKQIYDENALEAYTTKEGREQLIADALYDAAVGAALGGFSTGGTMIADDINTNRQWGNTLNAASEAFGTTQDMVSQNANQQNNTQDIAQNTPQSQNNAPQSNSNAEVVPNVEETQNAATEQNGSNQGKEETLAVIEAQIRAKIQEGMTASPDQYARINAEVDALNERYNALKAKQDAESEQQRRVQLGEVSNNFNTAANHIDNRTFDNVSSPKVKAFQFDHPELHQYYVDAAEILMKDAENATLEDKYKRGATNQSSALRMLTNQGMTKPRIIQCLNDIINNHGSENYADAKRVELALDDMLSHGYSGANGNGYQSNPDYIKAKQAIAGADLKSGWEQFLAENELALADGLVTDEQLRQEWEAQQAQQTNNTTTEAVNTTTAQNQTENTAQTVQNTAENATQDTQGNTGLATDERGYTGERVNTQDRVFETNLTDEEKAMPGFTEEEAQHIRHSDDEVLDRARQRINNDRAKTRSDLINSQSWTDEDTAAAGTLINDELAQAREAVKNGDIAQANELYEKLAELKKAWNKNGTEAGRALRQRKNFTANDIVAESANVLFGEKSKNEKQLRKLKPGQKTAIMGEVTKYADRYNNLQPGDTQGIIQLIKDVAGARKTTALFSNKTSSMLDSALNLIASRGESGEQQLRDVLTVQMKSIASDYISPGAINAVNAWRFMAMLSNPKTTNTNIGSNFLLGSVIETLSNNLATLPDVIISQATGTREVARDRSVFSKDYWNGFANGAVDAFVEIALDANREDINGGYLEGKGQTFKAVGNPLERFLARLEQVQQYQLYATDEAAKGATRATTTNALNKLAEKGKVNAKDIADIAENDALYRTMQLDNGVTKGAVDARRLLDRIKIGNKRTGEYGLGTDLAPFMRIGANAVAISGVDYNPAVSVGKALFETFKFAKNVKNGTVKAGDQAKVSKALGRVLSSSALVAGLGVLASKGIIADWDDDDKNLEALRRDENRSGTQLNLSALGRLITGKDATSQPDDDWISMGWMPVLNSMMTLGEDLADAYQADGKITFDAIKKSSWDAAYSAFMDFPAMSSITSLVNTYKYSEADNGWDKLAEIAENKVGTTLSGILVPNIVRAIANGTDKFERDTSSDSKIGAQINNILGGLPFARETLPERLDSFGNPVETDNQLQKFLNKVILPGAITQQDTTAAKDLAENIALETGNKSVVPVRNSPKTLKYDGESVKLTADDKRDYKKTYGNAYEKYLNSAMGSTAFNNLPSETQAAVMANLENLAEYEARKAVLPKGYQDNTKEAILALSDPASYYIANASMGKKENGDNKSVSAKQYAAFESAGITGADATKALNAIDVDNKGSYSQEEVYNWLANNQGQFTAQQMGDIWSALTTGKTTLADYNGNRKKGNNQIDLSGDTASGNRVTDFFSALAQLGK